MNNLNVLSAQGVYDEEELALLLKAYRMALHLVADRPAFFSSMNPEEIRNRLASRILKDSTIGQRDVLKLSGAAMRSVERAIRRSGTISVAY